MHSSIFSAGLALAAPLVSAATVPRAMTDIEARETTNLIPVSYATAYLDIDLKIADYGCGAAPEGNLVKNYTYFVDALADYYSVVAVPEAADDKSVCGQCMEVTYTNGAGRKRKGYGFIVDSTLGYTNFDKAGFAGLAGREAFDLGTLQATKKLVDIEKCRRARQ